MIHPKATDIDRTVRYTPRGYEAGNTGTLKGFNRHSLRGDYGLAYISFLEGEPDIGVSFADLAWDAPPAQGGEP